MGGKLTDLGFIEIPHRVDGAGHVAVDRAVADEEFGLVARAEDEAFFAGRIIVENGHPLPGHFVAFKEAAFGRVEAEVFVDLGRNVQDLGLQAEASGEFQGVFDVGLLALSIGHDQGENVFRAESPGREGGTDGGIESAGKAQDAFGVSELGEFVVDETRQNFFDEGGVNLHDCEESFPVNGG